MQCLCNKDLSNNVNSNNPDRLSFVFIERTDVNINACILYVELTAGFW